VPGISGIVVAPVTPMQDDLSLDEDGLRRLVVHLVESGIHGLTPCAMTGEAESLNMEEHQRVLRAVIDAADKAVPVYSGIGRPSLLETREMIAFAEEIGSDGLFVIPPFCNSYTHDEGMEFFEDVAARTSLPVMIYNCPPYSGIDFSPVDHARLAELPNVIATKEGNQAQLHNTVLAVGDSMSVFTARDSYLLGSLSVGAVGIVSFAANVAPSLLLSLYQAFTTGDIAEAQELHNALAPLVDALVARSYPLMIKTALNLLGLPAGPARRISSEISGAEERRLRELLEPLGALV
jgi:4-hydroxy-tetrahydrodipicolinate synthase